jgi:hypothetical protein
MESIMNNNNASQDGPERLGNVLSIVFLVALAALFVYGYAARIISTL